MANMIVSVRFSASPALALQRQGLLAFRISKSQRPPFADNMSGFKNFKAHLFPKNKTSNDSVCVFRLRNQKNANEKLKQVSAKKSNDMAFNVAI